MQEVSDDMSHVPSINADGRKAALVGADAAEVLFILGGAPRARVRSEDGASSVTIKGDPMSASSLAQVIEQYHRAVHTFVTGDPEPQKRLWSRRDDASLANPLGPPVRGWGQLEPTMERAASQIRDGAIDAFERISEYATPDLAYIVEIERTRAKIGGSDEVGSVALRVTTIIRREDDEWRIAHRHADPITTPRTVGFEPILER
jgi:ketosteroid isomerase-like protein